MAISWFVLSMIYLSMNVLPGQVDSFKCPCDSQSACIRQKAPADIEKEVFVVTDGSSDLNKWKWDSLTTVLVDESYEQSNIMCYTHNKGKRYGFRAKLAWDKNDMNEKNESISKKRIEEIVTKSESQVVDVVAVDLIDTLTNIQGADVKTFGDLLFDLKKALIPTVHKMMPLEMVCIVPWKPQCYGNDCTFTDEYLYHSCDTLIIDPTSFTVIEKPDTCRARASVPFTHLALGVDEYAAQGLSEKRIILGVPWHGYSYHCDKFHFLGKLSISKCDLAMINGTCDYMSARTKLTIGEMKRYHSEDITKSVWSSRYQAPVYSHYNLTTKNYNQIWFENVMSLRLKYQYAHEFGLKGIAIYYAEDLSEDSSLFTKGFNGAMWDWVLHGILKESVTQAPPQKYHADVVAGASIGCLLLGVLLGVMFTCLALRRRVTKPREPPFKRDQIEYHDDDDNLHL